MARIRSIHPDICTSETTAALSAELERTFTRLWTHCDDEGRCADNPRLIKAAIYPLHDLITATVLDVELAELVEHGLIVRYTVDDRRYLAVRSFREFQHPNRFVASKLPAPPDDDPAPAPAPPDRAPAAHVQRSEPAVSPQRDAAPVVVVGEVVGEGEGVVLPAAPDPPSTALAVVEPAVPATRKPNLLFDALVEACGWDYDEMPEMQRKATGTAASQLAKVKATPDEVRRRAAEYRARFPDMSYTPHAIAKHWASLTPRSRPNGTNGTPVLSRSEQALHNNIARAKGQRP